MEPDERAGPTASLLWAACRPHPDAAAVDTAVADGADLAAAVPIAIEQGIGPLLWRALRARGHEAELGSPLDLLRREAELRRAQAFVLLPHALATAVEPLTAAGMEPLVFKGPMLADRYPEPGLRPMVDLDLLLPREQHQRAVPALHLAGWRTVDVPGVHHDVVLRHPSVPDLVLELHWDLYIWNDRASHLTGDGLWARRVATEALGVGTFGLPVEVELVALAAHAGKPHHHFHRLIWSVDFAVIAAGDDDIDWDLVATTARDAGCRTALAVALRHATRLGADVPEELCRVGGGRVRRAALEPLLDPSWPLQPCDEGLHRRLRYALWDSRSRRAALLLGEITEAGPRYAPRRAARLTGLAARRTWRSLRSPVDAP